MSLASRVRVKICGITSPGDAQTAVAAGTDAIGLLFSRSPRQVTISQARAIRDAVGPFVAVVGVFVNESVSRIFSIADEVGLTAVQLHGEEPVETAREIQRKIPVIKAFRIEDRDSFTTVRTYDDVSGYLFDAYVPGGERGGTGQAFNWSVLDEQLQGELSARPWVLAGGLNPDNVATAINLCRPYAVDVSSGVESEPGIKDPKKVRQFIERVRRCHIE